MSHLLALSVGPVQEFIAAARRTRDLWFGSYLLSEVSKAAAQAVDNARGQLIFPASLTADNVANIILAELGPGTQSAQTVAKVAREAAQNRWKTFAEDAYHRVQRVVNADIWQEQVGEVIEFYAAWVPMTGDYADARKRVMKLLAGRKNCRDFQPGHGRAGVPKSSLDGLRESVLLGPPAGEPAATFRNRWPQEIRRRLRVRSGEQLDVVGLTKRVAEGTRPYPSVSRVAADPWVRGIIAMDGQEHLNQLRQACQEVPTDAVHRLDAQFTQYRDFPFEGTTLFRSRHHEWWEEAEADPERPSAGREAPPWYRPVDEALRNLERFAAAHGLGGEPSPYLAVIVADGDRMGEALSKLETPAEHCRFSTDLARFAGQADTIVAGHKGVLVYAGGDDVLAFVPVDKCLQCAQDLHQCFGQLLAEWGQITKTDLTLSVGVAIAHFLENLEDLLEYGRQAEKAAKKPDRNGLAIHLRKRSGSPIQVRDRWPKPSDHPGALVNGPVERISELAGMLVRGELPTRLATDLGRMVPVYEAWPQETAEQQEILARAIRGDVQRVVSAKRPGLAGSVREQLQEKKILESITNAAALKQLADELLIARQIAEAYRQSGRK